jgi:hypothetical protein
MIKPIGHVRRRIEAPLRSFAHRLLNHPFLALRSHLRGRRRIRSFVGRRCRAVRRLGCPIRRRLRGLRVGSRLLDHRAIALTHCLAARQGSQANDRRREA